MSADPGSLFGSLLRGCVSDRYLKIDRGLPLEDVAFLLLGICSSVVTTYLLSLAGILV